MDCRMLVSVGLIGLCLGCSDTMPSSTGVTPAAFNAAGAPTVQFSVPDMMCPEGCAVAVNEILAKQPGVTDVVVDFDAKTATVAVEEGTFDAEAALAALVDKQFDNSTLKSAEPGLPSVTEESAAD